MKKLLLWLRILPTIGLCASIMYGFLCVRQYQQRASVVVSMLIRTVIRKHLVACEKWSVWLLLFVISFIEVKAFLASAEVGPARWQVNIVLSMLYIAGISVSGDALFKQQPKKRLAIIFMSLHEFNRPTQHAVDSRESPRFFREVSMPQQFPVSSVNPSPALLPVTQTVSPLTM